MKRIISILLALVILISISAVSASAKTRYARAYQYKDFFCVYRDNDIHIVDYYGSAPKVKIPSIILGRKVVGIGDIAEKYYRDDFDALWSHGFWENEYVEEVTIPDTVKELGYRCFADCKNLRKVKLGNGLKELCANAFWGCSKLKSIKLPDSLEVYDDEDFSGTKISKIRLGKNVKEVYLPNILEPTPLKSITVSKKNKYFSAKNGVLYNKNKTNLVYYPAAKRNKTFKIPNKVETISEYSFSYNSYVKTVKLPENLKEIADGAFNGNKSISKIKFTGKKKVIIAKEAFFGLEKLKSITIPKNVIKIEKRAIGYVWNDHADYAKAKGFIIKGKKNSAAHKYAKKYKFKFVAV